ncbi:MAG TPA: hypothetical protein VLR94_00300, partial [Acidobacteriota bacterium]|nr:hypothetical protein [Acidobacteriota bacterium]
MKPVLQFEDVCVTARAGDVCRINDLRIRSREFCVLYGLNPELQELLVRLATGAAVASAGTVSVLGTNAGNCPENLWFQLVEKIAVLDPSVAVSDRISIGEYLADAFLTRDPAIGEPALSRNVLRIAELMKFTIAELSMNFAAAPATLQWKARLGRHLAGRPRLLMLPLNL